MAKENLLNKLTWVDIYEDVDEHGVHAEIHIDEDCAPLVGLIYNDLINQAITGRGKLEIRGLSDRWQDRRYRTRIISVYPKNTKDFRKWMSELETVIVEILKHEMYLKVEKH